MQGVFDDYVVAPDPEDWIRIEKSLAKRKARRLMMWTIWSAAASLLLLLALYTGGILNHIDNTAVKIATNHSTQANQSATPVVKDNRAEKDIRQTAIEKKRQLSTNLPSEKVQQNANPTLSSHNLPVNKNALASIPDKTILSPSGRHQTTPSPVKKIQKAKTAEANKMLLASDQLRHDITNKSSNKISSFSLSQSTDSMKNNYSGKLFVHAIIPKPVTSVYNTLPKQGKSNDIKNKLADNSLLAENKKDDTHNHGSSIRFKGLSISNSNGFQMQTSTDGMNYSSGFASQMTSNMYLTSVKKLDITSLSTPNIGDLFQNKQREFTPPLTFGLTINLALQGNWRIETGIQYTNLRSKGEVTIGSSNEVRFVTMNKYKVDENLHYLGVPFMVNYVFYHKRKTTSYISTGFSIEKGIIANYKAVSADNIPGLQPIYSHNPIEGLQYSFNSGIGISYKFISHFELFAQPSITYYFDPHGKNTTIYSEHPWLFNMRSGIRYSVK